METNSKTNPIKKEVDDSEFSILNLTKLGENRVKEMFLSGGGAFQKKTKNPVVKRIITKGSVKKVEKPHPSSTKCINSCFKKGDANKKKIEAMCTNLKKILERRQKTISKEQINRLGYFPHVSINHLLKLKKKSDLISDETGQILNRLEIILDLIESNLVKTLARVRE